MIVKKKLSTTVDTEEAEEKICGELKQHEI